MLLCKALTGHTSEPLYLTAVSFNMQNSTHAALLTIQLEIVPLLLLALFVHLLQCFIETSSKDRRHWSAVVSRRGPLVYSLHTGNTWAPSTGPP